MRILFCNKYNHPFSGTEVYLFELMQLMRAHGHETALFSMADPRGDPTEYDRHFVPHIDFKEKANWARKVRCAAHAVYSWQARRKIRELIREFRPDLAHVRNIYHHLSPSILWELKAQGVPVIYHLNDFKLLCPSYNFVSQGSACEACKGGAYWNIFRSKCYPGLEARVTLAAEAYVHRWLDTYRRCVDLFLAPSKFVREKFVDHGWDGARFQVLPHFQAASQALDPSGWKNGHMLYVGRLSAEKGVADLVRAVEEVPQVRLVIAGDGPQRSELQQLADDLKLKNVEFVGYVGPVKRDQLIAGSRFTVLPSHAYETFGKTILESHAQGRAVIASDIGSRRELVRQGETGILYRCGDVDQLAGAIRLLEADPALAEKMGQAGWERVRRDHSPDDHYEKLMSQYEGLVGRIRRRLRVAFIGGRGVISKYSGIESYYEEVGKRLVERGQEVSVYCRNYFTPKIKEHNGMRVVRLPAVRSKHLETITHTILSTLHAMTQGYDIVHYHALGPALFSFLPRWVGAKTVVTVQGLDWQRRKWGRLASAVLRWGEKASVRFPDATMVVSRSLQERYRSVHGVEANYAPNGGVLREKTKPHEILKWGLEPGRYVLFLGRFSPEKGCDLLIEAFERLDIPEIKLVMAGSSAHNEEYAQELWSHASERILMLDWISGSTLDELLTNAMIFVLPSDLEGLSLALLDAMGCGLCVLTSDVPENRELVQGAGFTFQCGSAVDLAEQLQFLIANPRVRESAARSARKRIEEQYQWSQVTAEIERVYLRMLGWKTPESCSTRPSIGEESASRQYLPTA